MNTPSRELIAKIIFQLLVFFRQRPRRSARDSSSPPSPTPLPHSPSQPPSSNSSYPDPDPLALARVTWVGTRLVKSQVVPPQILVHIPNKYNTIKMIFGGHKCLKQCFSARNVSAWSTCSSGHAVETLTLFWFIVWTNKIIWGWMKHLFSNIYLRSADHVDQYISVQ